ncbi:hypothetical protein HGM15179_010056, partial [Zosterops borbonicus]
HFMSIHLQPLLKRKQVCPAAILQCRSARCRLGKQLQEFMGTGGWQSAIFNFQSLLTVILLLICTCAYIRSLAPSLLDKNKTGLLGIFWKCARI